MSRTPNYNFFKPGPADRVDPVADIADGMDLIDAAIAAEAATRAAAITALSGTTVAVVNVMGYGATGDGSTNDTAAINLAVAALPAAGGVLYFPAGTYMVTPAAITAIPSKTKVQGAGAGNTIIKWRANSATTSQVWYTFIAATGATDIEVTGITFHGNRSNGNHSSAVGAEAFDALWFSSDNARIWIHHNRFTNFRGDSIYVTRSSGQPSGITFEFNTVDDVGIKESGDGGNTRQGIAIISADNVRIVGNRFSTIGSYAVDLESDTPTVQTFHNVVIDGNIFDGVVDGAVNIAPAAVADATDITITGNTVYGVTAQGFLVKGTGITVAGNTATNCTTRGVRTVSGSSRITVTGNTFRVTGSGAGVTGVYLEDSNYCTVVGNVLMGTAGAAGAKEAGTSDFNFLGPNAIEHATRYVVTGSNTWTDVATKAALSVGGSLTVTGTTITLSGASGNVQATGGVMNIDSAAGNPQTIIKGGGTEQGRFTSGGLALVSTPVVSGAAGMILKSLGGDSVIDASTGIIIFKNAGTEKARIDSGGSLTLVGTTVTGSGASFNVVASGGALNLDSTGLIIFKGASTETGRISSAGLALVGTPIVSGAAGLTLKSLGGDTIIDSSTGIITFKNAGTTKAAIDSGGSYSQSGTSITLSGASGNIVASVGVLNLDGVGQMIFKTSGGEAWRINSSGHLVAQSTRQIRAGALGVGNSAAATTPGSVVKKIEVFDQAGASLGYLPVYSAIT